MPSTVGVHSTSRLRPGRRRPASTAIAASSDTPAMPTKYSTSRESSTPRVKRSKCDSSDSSRQACPSAPGRLRSSDPTRNSENVMANAMK